MGTDRRCFARGESVVPSLAMGAAQRAQDGNSEVIRGGGPASFSSHTEVLAYQHSGNAIPAFDGAGLEHACAGRLARPGVAHRRRHCGLLPFLAHSVGEPDNRLFDLLHSAGILCHRVVRRADAVLEAFPATTWQMAYADVSPAVGSRCISGNLLAVERKSLVASAGSRGAVASACLARRAEFPAHGNDQHGAVSSQLPSSTGPRESSLIDPFATRNLSVHSHLLRKSMGAARYSSGNIYWDRWLGGCVFRALPLSLLPSGRPLFPGDACIDYGVLPGHRVHHLFGPVEFWHPAGVRLAISHVCSFVLVLPGSAVIDV